MQFIQDALAVWPKLPLMPAAPRVVMERIKFIAEVFEAGFRLSECSRRLAKRFLPTAQAAQAQIVRVQAAHGVADNQGFRFQPRAVTLFALHPALL